MLADRVKKARAAARFVGFLSHDKGGQVRALSIPGSEGKRYHLIVRRVPDHAEMSVECRLEVGANGHLDCRGNSNGTVCYHGLAGLIALAQSNGYQVSVCASRPLAERTARIHAGKVARVRSRQGTCELWFVYHK